MFNRSKITLLLCFIVSASKLTAGADPDQKITYKKSVQTDLKLHVFFPKSHNFKGKTPAIIFFFGGGWSGGSPKQFYPQCAHLAKRGMVAISAEYRVKKSHGTDPKSCITDGKSAMRWLRNNAAKLGVDPNKIAAGGGSAGGHVAAAIATTKGFNEDGEDTSVSCIPQALVLYNPVFDNGPNGYGHKRVKAYWKDFSPMHNISAKTPPTTVFLGTKDDLIPVATAKKYQSLMHKAGNRCDLHLYPGEKHGFFNKSKYNETIAEATRFLESLGYIKAAK